MKLFERLPAIHRTKDAELGRRCPGPLAAYLAPVEEAFTAVKASIEALYHDLFIERAPTGSSPTSATCSARATSRAIRGRCAPTSRNDRPAPAQGHARRDRATRQTSRAGAASGRAAREPVWASRSTISGRIAVDAPAYAVMPARTPHGRSVAGSRRSAIRRSSRSSARRSTASHGSRTSRSRADRASRTTCRTSRCSCGDSRLIASSGNGTSSRRRPRSSRPGQRSSHASSSIPFRARCRAHCACSACRPTIPISGRP